MGQQHREGLLYGTGLQRLLGAEDGAVWREKLSQTPSASLEQHPATVENEAFWELSVQTTGLLPC